MNPLLSLSSGLKTNSRSLTRTLTVVAARDSMERHVCEPQCLAPDLCKSSQEGKRGLPLPTLFAGTDSSIEGDRLSKSRGVSLGYTADWLQSTNCLGFTHT